MPRGVIRGYGEIKRFLPAMGCMFLLALAFFLFARVAGAQMTQGQCDSYSFPQSPTDRDILIKFYCDTGGPDWTTNTNWGTSSPLTNWHGVLFISGRVLELRLSSNNLSGSIPPQLGGLSSLELLALNGNNLGGSIPPQLGGLSSLVTLALSGNNLSGSIPPQLGGLANLLDLFLNNNQLGGSIPPDLGDLTTLSQLYLHENQLSGMIPPKLGNLDSLLDLRLQGNRLSGPIPSELGGLTNLQELQLQGNRLSGPIPSELGNLTMLQLLWLDNNELSGPIPSELGNLTMLQLLYLQRNNELSGPIPSELGNLVALRELFLNNNELSGPIPPKLGNLDSLLDLRLQGNRLSGPIPSELGNLTMLEYLTLANNTELSGTMPSQLRGLTSLSTFDIQCTGVTEPTDSAFQAWLGSIASYTPPPHSSCETVYHYEFEFRLSSRDLEKEKNLTTTEEGAALTIAEGETLVYYVRLKPGLTKKNLPENLTVDITGHEGTDLIFNRSTHFTLEPRHVNGESWKVLSITANPDDDTRDDTVELVHEACCLGERDTDTYAYATLTVTIDEDKRVSPVPSVTPPVPPPAPVTPAPEEAELDLDALVAIYDASGGGNWNRKDNWDSMEPIGEWHGVMTDEEGRVVELDLGGNNLAGTVAGEVADLEKLQKLDLSGNPDLTGELPPGLTGLADLTELYIDGTQVCPPDDDAFRAWLDGLATFRGNDSCDDKEPEQPEEPPVGEMEETGGGCAVASGGGVGGSVYSLAFAVFALAAIWGKKSLLTRKQYR